MGGKHLRDNVGGSSKSSGIDHNEPNSPSHSEPDFPSYNELGSSGHNEPDSPGMTDFSDSSPTSNYVFGSSQQVYVRRRKKRHRHRARRIILAILLAIVLILAVCGFVFYRSVASVMDAASQTMSLATQMQNRIADGDMEGLASDIVALDEQTSSIREELESPLWSIASLIPVYGSDVSAAKVVVTAIDDLVGEALLPMAEDLTSISFENLISDGKIDVDSITRLLDDLVAAEPVISEANESIQAIGDTHISRVTSIVETAKSGMSLAAEAAEWASSFASVLPDMLGADGQEKTYLIVAMNNSEIRAAGGFSGAEGTLTISNGQIDLGEFESVMWLYDGRTVPVTDEESYLFMGGLFNGDAMELTSGDALYNPDFPHSASRIAEFWTALYGDSIDGVIALDPVFLQSLLAICGEITSLDGTVITSENAAQYLLSEIYWLHSSGDDQDEIFADVATKAFDKVIDSFGASTLVSYFEAFSQGIEENRLLAWMEDDQAQAAMEQIGCSGAISTDTSTAETGVYVGNYSFSKLDWYLDLDVTVGEQTTNSDGSSSYSMQVTLTNTIDPDEEDELPAYVTANNAVAYSPGDELLRLHLYAPAGGSVSDVNISSENEFLLQEGSYNGIQVSFADVHLVPGQTVTVSYTVTTSVEAGSVPLSVRVTPTGQEF